MGLGDALKFPARVVAKVGSFLGRTSKSDEQPEPSSGGLGKADPWWTIGAHELLPRGEARVGYETPPDLSRTAEEDGRNSGAAWTPEDRALGPEAAPNRFISGGVGVRIGVLTQNAVRAGVAAAQRVRTVKARVDEGRARVPVMTQRLLRLVEQVLPPIEARARELEQVYTQRRDEWLNLPRSVRGYFTSHWPVLAVGVGVVLFDAAVLHGVLETSGATPQSVWLTSITVPLAIGFINHGIGVVAGAYGARVSGSQRARLSVVVLVAGLGSLLLAFGLLTIFRAQAADSQNAALSALASGDAGSQLSFFISPVWMGPLQISGSLAAISMTALWVMAKQGRDFKALVLEPARVQWQEAAGELQELKARIESTHRELEAAALAEHVVTADGQAAQVEVEAHERVLAAAIEAEHELERAIQARYETAWAYHTQIGRNGDVVRVARPTVSPRVGQPYTPAAVDVDGSGEGEVQGEPLRAARRSKRTARRLFWRPVRPSPVSSNGHHDHPVDPNHLSQL